jgi:hypothetical protein
MLELNFPRRGAVAGLAAAGALLSLSLLTAGLLACGSHSSSAGAARAAAKAGGASAAATSRPGAADPSAADETVSAVAAGRSNNAFHLRFDVRSHPGAGEPVDIDVVLTPMSEFDRVQVMFRGNEGIEIRSGAQMPPVEKPEIDVPLHHTLTVVPKSEGIYSISAVVLSDSSEGSVSRAYAIPLIAGAGLPEQAPDPGAAPAAQGAPPTAATEPPQAIQATQGVSRRPPGS